MNEIQVSPDLPDHPQDEIFLNAAQVKKRYGGVSDMALFRWLADEDIGFPPPVEIGLRRYWRLSELLKFEARCATRRAERHIKQRQATGRQRGAAAAADASGEAA
jgi:predicted DNA-binding transcriptional regulator AlpA